MMKLFGAAFLVLMILILINRQRVFVRDPLATVYLAAPRAGEAKLEKQAGVQVYINYSNDVLLMKDGAGAYSLLVQHWNRMPGTPVRLKCVHWMACLTQADHAPALPARLAGGTPYEPDVEMTNAVVSFVDGGGKRFRVELR